MAKQYRCGLVGTGGTANGHIEWYLEDPRTEVVAAADLDRARVDEYCAKYGVPHGYADYRAMLTEQQPDIVSICTWEPSHPEITIAAAEAGAQAVLCEKPMGIDLGGPMDMVRVCEERGTKLVINHGGRFGGHLAGARKLISEGAIGSPVFTFKRMGAGLLNIGTHTLDAFRWLLGDREWTRVVGWVQRTTNRFVRGSYCEDMTLALVEFEGGSQLSLAMDMDDLMKHHEWAITGSEGCIMMDRTAARLIIGDQVQSIEPIPQGGTLEELITWIEGGPEHRNSGRTSLVDQQICMAIYESARTRMRIEPPYEKRESPLAEMVEQGILQATGEPYDIRSARPGSAIQPLDLAGPLVGLD